MTWSRELFHYKPDGSMPWSISHATQPIVYVQNNIVRIYFSTRDENQRNCVSYIDLEINNSTVKIVDVPRSPSFDIGETGHFDCDGVYGASIVETEAGLRLYYSGWNAGKNGLFFSSIGSAISYDSGMTFIRESLAPILGRDHFDPWSCMAPFVLKVKEGYRMWYVSGKRISFNDKGDLNSEYDIKVADSDDGLNWRKLGVTAIPLLGNCSNIARSVIRQNSEEFTAWFSYKTLDSTGYRLGVSTSTNALSFDDNYLDKHKYEFGQNLPAWMQKDQCYPYSFTFKGELYLAISGNQYGKEGFGLFKWEEQ